MNNLSQAPLTDTLLSFGDQVSGQNQPDGSWYQPFSPAGMNSQGQVATGILATPSAAGAGKVDGYSDFSFGGQGGLDLFPQNGVPSAALLSTSDLSQPVNLQNATPPDTARFVVKGVRPNNNISLDTALPDGSTVGDRVNALSNDINNRTAKVIATPYGPVMQYGDRSDPVSIVTDVYNGTNFKKIFAGQNADPGLLGDAGNFAYGAVTARLGIPLNAAEIPAGIYSLLKHPASDWGWPYGMDPSARQQVPKGYGAK